MSNVDCRLSKLHRANYYVAVLIVLYSFSATLVRPSNATFSTPRFIVLISAILLQSYQFLNSPACTVLAICHPTSVVHDTSLLPSSLLSLVVHCGPLWSLVVLVLPGQQSPSLRSANPHNRSGHNQLCCATSYLTVLVPTTSPPSPPSPHSGFGSHSWNRPVADHVSVSVHEPCHV